MTRYAIGIDLGTTNTAVAAVDLSNSAAPVPFALTQVVAAAETDARALLPSFVYLPADAELPAGALALPWDLSRDNAAGCVGAFARERAAAVPGRVVSSAKSWLSHAGVDRNSGLLPVAAPDDVKKLSPVEVSARTLIHVVQAWDHAHPDQPMHAQQVVLTVPASFDAVARSLTQQAAVAAGIAQLTLLEEPQAALYAWVAAHADWRKQVRVGELILVVDIGGGTTDFSLIEVKEQEGGLQLARVAVGEHILLGGDNMDLALAYRVKANLELHSQKELDDWQLRGLVHACRSAKEALLMNDAIPSAAIAVASRGSKLVGGTLRSELLRDDLIDVLLEGFFPVVNADARAHRLPRTGLTTMGLPYAQDAAVTRHLAEFLVARAPHHVLYNGGVTKSSHVQQRLTDQLSAWLGRAVNVLPAADRDGSVAIGAAYYGGARTGSGVRIKSGASRAYYVGIERAQMAVPGVVPQVDAVCIAPLGMEEGSEVELARELGLIVGEPATFRFFSSRDHASDCVGTVVDPKRAQLQELAPIQTQLPGQSGAMVPVRLRARVTEVGTLEVSAVETATALRHNLEFDIRVR